jgi:hypothetical protein
MLVEASCSVAFSGVASGTMFRRPFPSRALPATPTLLLCRPPYSGAKNFVSKRVYDHLEGMQKGSIEPNKPFDFQRKDDLHSWLRVCVVNSDSILAEQVYAAVEEGMCFFGWSVCLGVPVL